MLVLVTNFPFKLFFNFPFAGVDKHYVQISFQLLLGSGGKRFHLVQKSNFVLVLLRKIWNGKNRQACKEGSNGKSLFTLGHPTGARTPCWMEESKETGGLVAYDFTLKVSCVIPFADADTGKRCCANCQRFPLTAGQAGVWVPRYDCLFGDGAEKLRCRIHKGDIQPAAAMNS